MNVRTSLIAVTASAVISDAMLLPFYPQLFRFRFGIDEPEHVGLYLTGVCLTAMLAFPLWARASKAIHPLRLLVWTQLTAGFLCLGCYAARSAEAFWIVSLGVVAFKASYLLIYPFLMSTEAGTEHARTIGTLALVVQLGTVFGALFGGGVLEFLNPEDVFLIMALCDLVQAGICLAVLRTGRNLAQTTGTTSRATPCPKTRRAVAKLCLTMVLFYFGSYLARPFFAIQWEAASGLTNTIVTGVVFAIPAAAALLALLFNNHRSGCGATLSPAVLPALLIGACGLLLQAFPSTTSILVGRGLYGWGVFQATVALDARLFALSKPDAYATDFSAASVFQNFGVAASSLAAGSLVGAYGPTVPFLAAAVVLLFTALLLPLLVASRAGANNPAIPVQGRA